MTAIGAKVTDLLVTALRKILQLRYRKHAAPSDEDFAVAVDLGGRDRGHAVIAEIFSPKGKKVLRSLAKRPSARQQHRHSYSRRIVIYHCSYTLRLDNVCNITTCPIKGILRNGAKKRRGHRLTGSAVHRAVATIIFGFSSRPHRWAPNTDPCVPSQFLRVIDPIVSQYR